MNLRPAALLAPTLALAAPASDGLPAGRYLLGISAAWLAPGERPIHHLALELMLPPGVIVPCHPDTGQLRSDAILPVPGLPILASGRYREEEGVRIALVSLGRKAWSGRFMALEIRVLPGSQVRASNLLDAGRLVYLRMAGGVDLEKVETFDATARTRISLSLSLEIRP